MWPFEVTPEQCGFPHAVQAALVVRTTHYLKSLRVTEEAELVLSSRPHAQMDAAQLQASRRGHWGIESVHYVRDVTFGEDACTVRTGHAPQNLGALRNLRDFLYTFDFVKMRADKNFVVSGVPQGVYCRGMNQPGEQYALYLHHSRLAPNLMSYIAMPGHYDEMLVLDIPGGTYKADWIDPASGAVISTATFTHQGGNQNFTTPEYTVDIALRIKRVH